MSGLASELALLAAVLAAVGFSMAVYGWTGGGRGLDDKTGRGGSFFLGYWVRNWFYWVVHPVIRGAVGLKMSPFFFNAAALGFGAASMVFFALGKLPSAGWMILLSGLADVMDGEVARGRGLATRAGAFLDSTLDRFSEFAAFIGLAAFFGSGWRGLAVLVALGGSLMVSYTRARGESLGVLCKKGLMQRAERMLLLGVGAIVDPSVSRAVAGDPGFVLTIIVTVIAAGTVGTAIYRTIWISRQLEKS